MISFDAEAGQISSSAYSSTYSSSSSNSENFDASDDYQMPASMHLAGGYGGCQLAVPFATAQGGHMNQFTHFLFASGDRSEWLVASRDAVGGAAATPGTAGEYYD